MATQKITIVRGTTNVFAVTVSDEDGDVYTLESGEVLRFGVKAKPGDEQYIFVKQATEANENGDYEFTVEVDDTAELPYGKYYYDCGLQSGQDFYNVIPVSTFEVTFNVTEWEGV